MSGIGGFLYFLLWGGGLLGGALFVTALTVVFRNRAREGVAQEQLRQAQLAVHEEYRDRKIVREAVDEVRREDVKALIRQGRA